MRSPAGIGHLLLRISVAFAFLYPPIDALSDPYSWIGYFPAFMSALPVEPLVLLHSFGAIEVALGIWILSGWKIRIPSIIAAAMLIAIVAFNLPQFQVLFRDVSIALAALALAIVPAPQRDLAVRS